MFFFWPAQLGRVVFWSRSGGEVFFWAQSVHVVFSVSIGLDAVLGAKVTTPPPWKFQEIFWVPHFKMKSTRYMSNSKRSSGTYRSSWSSANFKSFNTVHIQLSILYIYCICIQSDISYLLYLGSHCQYSTVWAGYNYLPQREISLCHWHSVSAKIDIISYNVISKNI